MMELFCIMLDLIWSHGGEVRGYSVLHIWAWRMQDQRYLLEGKMRAHWGFEKVADFGWQWR